MLGEFEFGDSRTLLELPLQPSCLGDTSPSPSLYLKRVMLTPAVYPAQCSV